MTRTRIAIVLAASALLAGTATQASAQRNKYTGEPVEGFLPLIFGDPGYGDPAYGYAYERPIRRHGRHVQPGPYGDDVPPPPFYDGEY